MKAHKAGTLSAGRRPVIGSATCDGATRKAVIHEAQMAFEEREVDEIVAENLSLNQKLANNTKSFNDILVYCKKTIEQQDDQIKRLGDIIARNDATYGEKLKKERTKAQEQLEELKLSVQRLNNENFLMKTQLSNQDQMELEIKELNQKLEQMRCEIEEKNEKTGKRELKERELVILTTERIRRELEIEFNEKITRVQKELRIQNLAQIKINEQIVKKVQNELHVKEREKEALRLELLKTQNELAVGERALAQCQAKKQRLENSAQRSRLQAEKMLKDSKRQLENVEKVRAKEALRQTETITILKNENVDLKRNLQSSRKEAEEFRWKYDVEKKQKEKTIERHADQNQKLYKLREFLQRVLEERCGTAADIDNKDYVERVMDENRSGLFTKLLLLLQNVPTV